MTEFGIQIGCLALRVTVVAVMAAAAAWWSARQSARSAVVVLAGAVAILLALSAASFCPTPDIGIERVLGPKQGQADSGLKTAPLYPNETAPGRGLDVSEAWRELRRFAAEAISPSLRQDGGTILAGLYGLGVSLAGLRLLFGWLSVQALRRGSQPITDPSMLQRLDSLRANLGCARPVELRECGEPGLAATVGWMRPVIFLPPEWRDWTEVEGRAVLAHELAHIRHKDYLIGLATRLCQVLHFYNPLLHWLLAQVRWQQELAADELASHTEVERGHYLKALASMALRSPARMPARAMPWSAMTGGALLRRIQMLRCAEKSRPLSRTLRGLLIGVLAAAGLLLSTLGSPATPPETAAEPFEIGYLPSQTSAFVGLRPAAIMQQPGMDKLKQAITAAFQEAKKLGFTVPDALNPENIDEIVTNLDFRGKSTGKSGKTALMVGCDSLFVRLKSDFDWPGFFKNLTKEFNAFAKSNIDEPVAIREEGVTIYRLGVVPMFGPTPLYFHMPDSRTVVFSGNVGRTAGGPASSTASFRQVLAKVASARQRDWGVGYKKVARAAIAVVGGRAVEKRSDDIVTPLSVLLDEQEQPVGEEAQALLRRLSENLRFVTLGVELGEGKPIHVVLEAKSTDLALELATAIDRAVRPLIEEIQRGNMDAQTRFIIELWQSRKLTLDGASLEWTAHSSVRFADLLASIEEDHSERPMNGKSD